MNNVVVLDACTIVNLARIDDGDFLEDKVRTLKPYVVEKVIGEVKDRYAPPSRTSTRKLHVPPYWGGLRPFEDKDVEDIADTARNFLNYQKKPNGELYSAALSLVLSRRMGEKVLFYTDDYPAMQDFRRYFDFQQTGYIGDTVDLLVFLYWLTPQGQFSTNELENFLKALRGEYTTKIKVLQKKMNLYASTMTTTKKALNRKFEMEGLAGELVSGRSLGITINKCKKFFDGDKSAHGKDIGKMLDELGDSPAIVDKIGMTLQDIGKYGIHKRTFNE